MFKGTLTILIFLKNTFPLLSIFSAQILKMNKKTIFIIANKLRFVRKKIIFVETNISIYEKNYYLRATSCIHS